MRDTATGGIPAGNFATSAPEIRRALAGLLSAFLSWWILSRHF
jgi:hypothetical protein